MNSPTWQNVERGRHHLKMNGRDLQVIRNPDRNDPRRYMAVVNQRPLAPPTRTITEAKSKAMNFIFGVERKPRGQPWDWSMVRSARDIEKELDSQPGPQEEAQPDPQPEGQPGLTLDQANAILDSVLYADFQEVQPDPLPEAQAVPALIHDPAPLGSQHEVTVSLTATFRTTDPEQVVSQLRVYIQTLRAELGGEVDCVVNQPPTVRI